MTVNFYGLGELPGASIIAAADIVAGETGDLRQLPILPARGVDVVGLTTGILPGINVDAGPRSWVQLTWMWGREAGCSVLARSCALAACGIG